MRTGDEAECWINEKKERAEEIGNQRHIYTFSPLLFSRNNTSQRANSKVQVSLNIPAPYPLVRYIPRDDICQIQGERAWALERPSTQSSESSMPTPTLLNRRIPAASDPPFRKTSMRLSWSVRVIAESSETNAPQSLLCRLSLDSSPALPKRLLGKMSLLTHGCILDQV